MAVEELDVKGLIELKGNPKTVKQRGNGLPNTRVYVRIRRHTLRRRQAERNDQRQRGVFLRNQRRLSEQRSPAIKYNRRLADITNRRPA